MISESSELIKLLQDLKSFVFLIILGLFVSMISPLILIELLLNSSGLFGLYEVIKSNCNNRPSDKLK